MLTSPSKQPRSAANSTALNATTTVVMGANAPTTIPSASVEYVTPAMAREWVQKNDPRNRLVSKANVKKYSADILAHRWALTGDPIRFDVDGTLVDGQHRLLACVDAGEAFWTYVVRGLPRDAKVHMDLGMKRTTGMILTQLGHTYTNQVAAAVLNLLLLKNQKSDHRGRHSTPEIVDFLQRHPNLEQAIARIYTVGGDEPVSKGRRNPRGGQALGPSPGVLGAIYYAAAFLCGEQGRADAFLDVFKSGVPAYVGDPAHMWRERLIRERNRGLRLSREQQLRGTVHAWNLFRNELTVSKFRIPDEVFIEGLNTGRI